MNRSEELCKIIPEVAAEDPCWYFAQEQETEELAALLSGLPSLKNVDVWHRHDRTLGIMPVALLQIDERAAEDLAIAKMQELGWVFIRRVPETPEFLVFGK